jgi:2-C-methyl-D-erythritol 2,4-cyclodiphosphate synthase
MTPTIQRVGIGTDVHRLVSGRKLVLGHIPVEFERGLAGHSDGDVVLHAITDALAGAAALPDIGDMFPDTDPAWKDADSGRLLAEMLDHVHRRGYAVVNVDVTIQAEKPKLSTYKSRIREEIARLLGLANTEAVSVKAKTNEGLDAIGRGEAIGCIAIAGLAAMDENA